jgi:hypothetical protein
MLISLGHRVARFLNFSKKDRAKQESIAGKEGDNIIPGFGAESDGEASPKMKVIVPLTGKIKVRVPVGIPIDPHRAFLMCKNVKVMVGQRNRMVHDGHPLPASVLTREFDILPCPARTYNTRLRSFC